MKLVLLTIFLLFSCGRPHAGFSVRENENGIIGGTRTSSSDAITHVTVTIEYQIGDEVSNCSGTLISKDTVLTAAHCMPSRRTPIKIIFFDGKFARVVGHRIHPDYRRKKDSNDFALLRFKSDKIREWALLPAPGFSLKRNQKLSIAGSGYVRVNNEGNGKLRKLDVWVKDPQVSASDFLIAEGSGKGACFGDSGGPAYIERGHNIVVVGVDSREGLDDVNCGTFEIYSSVAYALRWIEQGKTTSIQLL